jgi:hypothetical protein
MGRMLIVLAASVAVVAAPASAREAGCGPPSAHTEAANRLVRVYAIEDMADMVLHYFACFGARGRPFALGSVDENVSSSGDERGLAATAGRYAAFVHGRCNRETCGLTVDVVDVRARAGVQHASRGGNPVEVVLSRHGLAGLLAFEDTSPVGRPPDRYVMKLDGAGVLKLDSAPGVRRLSVRGEQLSWRHGSEHRSAPLVRRRTCGPRGEGVGDEAHSASMRIYSTFDGSETEYLACLYRGGKPVTLGYGFDGEGSLPPNYLTQWRFAGRYTAFVDDATSSVDPVFTFSVVDVSAPRVAHRFEGHGFYGNAVVTFDGSAGLLARTPTPRVVAFDARGETELDRGDGVSRLRLRGADTLTWRHGDAAMSYRLR